MKMEKEEEEKRKEKKDEEKLLAPFISLLNLKDLEMGIYRVCGACGEGWEGVFSLCLLPQFHLKCAIPRG